MDNQLLTPRGPPLAIAQIIEAIMARRRFFLRLPGRAFSEPVDTLREILPGQFHQVVIRFKDALTQSLPELQTKPGQPGRRAA